MKQEKDCVYEIENDASILNENKIMKPYGYQELFEQVADKHLTAFNAHIDTTLKYDLAWALISLSVEIVNPVISCMKLYASTWHSQKRGPFFRREYIFKNESGEVMFKGSSFSVLLDLKCRSIFRKKEAPFFIPEPVGGTTIEAFATFKPSVNFQSVSDRTIYNSYIDCLGHVNNCRYGEFAYDTFSEEEIQNLDKLKRMDIYFLSELRNKDNFSILKAYASNKILFEGYNNTKNDKSFDIVMTF